MDFSQPVRGKMVEGGLWVPDSAFEQKADRTQTGIATGDYSGVIEGASRAESKFKDYQSYLEAIKTVPWVYAAVSLLAYSFATAPGDLVDVDTDDPIEDPHDPFLQIWSRPNPNQSGMVFRELMGMFIELAGEAYISMEEMDAGGQPHELYLPSPARMRIVQSKKTGETIGYAYDTSGYDLKTGRYLPSFIPYSVDEIIHIKAANPLNYLRGLGNIEAMETTMDTMVAMSRNELSYWQSGGRITGVLETDQQVDNETFDRLVQRWRQFTADKRQRFKTAILEQGLKYSPVAEGFKGLDYSKLDVAKRDFVLANFGIPKNKLGIIEDAQYKSDEADRFFWSETMEPRLTRFEDHIQPLVDRFGANRAWKFERKNWEDDTVKLNNAMMMRSLKAFSQNEIRVYMGAPTLSGKSGDVVILQQTDVPVQIDEMDKASATGVAGGGPPPLKPPDDPAKLKPPTVPPHAHAAGTNPQAGVSTAANGNENGRTGAVDATGHLPNKPNIHNAAEGASAAANKSWKDGWSEETIAALDEEERDVLRQNFEREIKATQEVARNLRARGRRVKTSGLRRVVEYAEKAIAVPQPRDGNPVRPGTAEYVATTTKRLRDTLTIKFSPQIREGFSAQRRALTPVLSKILKITSPEERRTVMHAEFPHGKGPAPVIQALHAEAANEGWRIGKRSIGFTAKTPANFETKAKEMGRQPFVSPFLDQRYERTIGTSITGIDEVTETGVMDLVDEGLRRGYSPLQIANGVPDESFDGVNSVFDDAYRAEEIARTETMFALNWGQGNSLLDSGVTLEEAMDGSEDPICAARNGETYEIDPDTGFAVDADGNEIQDHPNGTLAFIPTGDLSDLLPTGGIEELGTDWETKGDKPGHEYHGNQYGGVHEGAHGYEQNVQHDYQPGDKKKKPKHVHGNIAHTHAGGGASHSHGSGPKSENWTNTGPGGETVAAEKGDVSGHEFHGNQWTANSGRTIAEGHGIEQGDVAKYSAAALEEHVRRGHAGSLEPMSSRTHIEARHAELHSKIQEGSYEWHQHTPGVDPPHTTYAPRRPMSGVSTGHPAGSYDSRKEFEGEVKEFVAALRDSTAMLAEIATKGDVMGHEFHGNQWRTGIGAGELHYHTGAGRLPHAHEAAMSNHEHPGKGPSASDHAVMTASSVIRTLNKTGGFTIDVSTGTKTSIGDHGFGVSPFPEREQVFEKAPTTHDIAQYIDKNHDLLSQPGHNVGGWRDEATGKTHLDVSIVTSSENEAHALAAQHNQIAIFNYKTGESIPTRRAA